MRHPSTPIPNAILQPQVMRVLGEVELYLVLFITSSGGV